MKCRLRLCGREATPPFVCCTPVHGWQYKQILDAIRRGKSFYQPGMRRFNKYITEDQRKYYSQFLNNHGKKLSN